MYLKQNNFYDKLIIFSICDNESKHTSKNTLIDQRNKHNTHVKYDEIQYQKLSKTL